MRTKREEDFVTEFDAEFHSSWNEHRGTPRPFAPHPAWVERVTVVSINGDTAIIKRMDEDGEVYTAEVPVSDLDDFSQ